MEFQNHTMTNINSALSKYHFDSPDEVIPHAVKFFIEERDKYMKENQDEFFPEFASYTLNCDELKYCLYYLKDKHHSSFCGKTNYSGTVGVYCFRNIDDYYIVCVDLKTKRVISVNECSVDLYL